MNHTERIEKIFPTLKMLMMQIKKSVKLYSDYVAILTKNKEQQANLLQIVEKTSKKLVTVLNRLSRNSQQQHLQTLSINSNTSSIKGPIS